MLRTVLVLLPVLLRWLLQKLLFHAAVGWGNICCARRDWAGSSRAWPRSEAMARPTEEEKQRDGC